MEISSFSWNANLNYFLACQCTSKLKMGFYTRLFWLTHCWRCTLCRVVPCRHFASRVKHHLFRSWGEGDQSVCSSVKKRSEHDHQPDWFGSTLICCCDKCKHVQECNCMISRMIVVPDGFGHNVSSLQQEAAINIDICKSFLPKTINPSATLCGNIFCSFHSRQLWIVFALSDGKLISSKILCAGWQ